MGKGRAVINLTGQRFTRLIAQRQEGVDGSGNALWLCRCDCGNTATIPAISLKAKSTRSCGCLAKETAASLKRKHGMYGTKVYRAWKHVLDRCKPDAHCARNYAERGITNSFQSFEEFYAEVGDPPDSRMMIDRIDNDRGYEPGNVRWATAIQQHNNKRTNRVVAVEGETKTITEWARETGLSKSGMGGRISKGADVLAPVRKLGSEPLTYKGKTKPIGEWSKTTGIPLEAIQHRLTRGWSVEKALDQPPRPPRNAAPGSDLVTYKKQTRSIADWSKRTGLTIETIQQRIRLGWPVEKTLTQPLRLRVYD